MTGKYSGKDKTGICICGHRRERHHLEMVMNIDYYEETGEIYIPQECEAYGFNETGGMKKNENGEWVDHCHGYKDSGDSK